MPLSIFATCFPTWESSYLCTSSHPSSHPFRADNQKAVQDVPGESRPQSLLHLAQLGHLRRRLLLNVLPGVRACRTWRPLHALDHDRGFFWRRPWLPFPNVLQDVRSSDPTTGLRVIDDQQIGSKLKVVRKSRACRDRCILVDASEVMNARL